MVSSVGSAGTKRKKGQSMKILLQHARTRLYFRGLGDWTANPHEAFDFQHSQRATDFVRQHRLTGVAVVVTFIDNGVVETYTTPIESPPQMLALAAAA